MDSVLSFARLIKDFAFFSLSSFCARMLAVWAAVADDGDDDDDDDDDDDRDDDDDDRDDDDDDRDDDDADEDVPGIDLALCTIFCV
jgi:hypothetical protein